MKYKVDVNHDIEAVIIRIKGNLDLVKTVSVLKSLVKRVQESGKKKILVNCKGTFADNVSSNDIEYLASLFELHAKVFRQKWIAFVVSDMLGYGLLRQWEAFLPCSLELNVEIFQLNEEAESWLSQK